MRKTTKFKILIATILFLSRMNFTRISCPVSLIMTVYPSSISSPSSIYVFISFNVVLRLKLVSCFTRFLSSSRVPSVMNYILGM